MKALDYFNKYYERLDPLLDSLDAAGATVKELFFEFSEEVKTLSNIRHSKDDQVTLAILREQNQKWNALFRLLEKRWGVSAIAENGFKLFWNHEMPELKI